MNITRAGSQPSSKGPAGWFSGTVRIGPLWQGRGMAGKASDEQYLKTRSQR